MTNQPQNSSRKGKSLRDKVPDGRRHDRCQACGHTGGALTLERSTDLDYLATSSGLDAHQLVPPMLVCSGALFALDGPVECLRRVTGHHPSAR